MPGVAVAGGRWRRAAGLPALARDSPLPFNLSVTGIAMAPLLLSQLSQLACCRSLLRFPLGPSLFVLSLRSISGWELIGISVSCDLGTSLFCCDVATPFQLSGERPRRVLCVVFYTGPAIGPRASPAIALPSTDWWTFYSPLIVLPES